MSGTNKRFLLGLVVVSAHALRLSVAHFELLSPILSIGFAVIAKRAAQDWFSNTVIYRLLTSIPMISSFWGNLKFVLSAVLGFLLMILDSLRPSLKQFMREPYPASEEDVARESFAPLVAPNSERGTLFAFRVVNRLRSHPARATAPLKALRAAVILAPAMLTLASPLELGRSPLELLLHAGIAILTTTVSGRLLLHYPSKLASKTCQPPPDSAAALESAEDRTKSSPPNLGCRWKIIVRNVLLGYLISFTFQYAEHYVVFAGNNSFECLIGTCFWGSVLAFILWWFRHQAPLQCPSACVPSNRHLSLLSEVIFPEWSLLELLRECTGHHWLPIPFVLAFSLISAWWILFAWDSTENLFLMIGLAARAFRDSGTIVGKVTPSLWDPLLQHGPTTEVLERVFRGPHVTGFNAFKDIVCTLQDTIFCQSSSEAQYLTDLAYWRGGCVAGFMFSILSNIFSFLGVFSAASGAVSSAALAMLPHSFSLARAQPRANMPDHSHHMLRSFCKYIHQIISDSAALYSPDPFSDKSNVALFELSDLQRFCSNLGHMRFADPRCFSDEEL